MEKRDRLQSKVQLLQLAEKTGNVSEACRQVGYSRDSYYRLRKLYMAGGEDALREVSRSKPLLKNRVPLEVENKVVEMAILFPHLGQVRLSIELQKINIHISPGGVRSVWLRHDLNTEEKRRQRAEMQGK